MSDYTNFGIISEAHLARLLSRIKDNEFAIVTAFRAAYSKKENIKRNRELLSTLAPIKAGAYSLVGHWQEAPEDVDYETAKKEGLLTDVTEESFLVVKPKDITSSDFAIFIGKLVNKYDQDAALYSNGSEYFLIDQEGDFKKIGDKITLNKVNQAYSTMKGKSGIPFVFEGLRNADHIASAQALKQCGLRTHLSYWNEDRNLERAKQQLESARKKVLKGNQTEEIFKKISDLEKIVESF